MNKLLGMIGSKVWGWIAAAGGVFAVIIGIFFFGRSTGKDSERRSQLEADQEAQAKAQNTSAGAMEATHEAQGRANDEKARAEAAASEEKVKAQNTGKTSGGIWGILLLVCLSFTVAACGGQRVVVQYPMIPALQVQPRPGLVPWTIDREVVGEACYEATKDARMAIITNEARLKGTIKAYEAIIQEYQTFRQEYMHQSDYDTVMVPVPPSPATPVRYGWGGPYVRVMEVDR